MASRPIHSPSTHDRRPIPSAPAAFDGPLEALFRLHIESVLPDAEVVRRFHEVLVAYLQRRDPLFVVRYVAGLERGQTIQVPGGRIRPSDNSPAWMIHRLLFDKFPFPNVDDLAVTLDRAMPCHFHQMAGIPTVNGAGWHVAHVFPAKDGNTDYRQWSRGELARRFVRNLHPCNCFYVPKAEWQRYGGDADVLAFAAAVYRERYDTIWPEFLELAGAQDLQTPRTPASEFRVVYGGDIAVRGSTSVSPRASGGVVEYAATRLLFRRDVIDALLPHQCFRVITRDHGTFEFSRDEFLGVFDNIVQSVSWQRDGIYHMTRPPKKAMPFRVAPPTTQRPDTPRPDSNG